MKAVCLAAICFSICAAQPALAASQTLAICGSQVGKAYFPASGFVPAGEGGWHDDRVTGGRTTLSKSPSGDYDILFADATGGTYSSTAEGAVVARVRHEPDESAFLVVYPTTGVVEVYSFVRVASGAREMVLTQSKGGAIKKFGAYSAPCSVFRDE